LAIRDERRCENGGRRTSQPLNSAAEIWFRGAVGTPKIDPQLAIRCQNPIKNGWGEQQLRLYGMIRANAADAAFRKAVETYRIR
jgi:hypothetical protein